MRRIGCVQISIGNAVIGQTRLYCSKGEGFRLVEVPTEQASIGAKRLNKQGWQVTCNKNSRKHRRGPIRHIDLKPGVIEDRPQLRAIIPNIHSRDDQPVFNASTDDSRVRARLGMMVFWVLALQRHPQERSPVLTYGVCERTRSALSLQ